MKTLLILGSSWLIGSQFHHYFSLQGSEYTILTPSHEELDITNYPQLTQYFEHYHPDIVINCTWKVGHPNIDRCESHQEETLHVNTLWAVQIALLCKQMGIYSIYIGSGCIYQGSKNGSWYTEDDEPNFSGSFYSRSKIKTQELLIPFDVLQIRIRMPILSHPHPRNFIDKIVRYTHVISEDNAMTIVDDMLPATEVLMKKHVTGIINMTNPGVINHAQILDLYKQHVNPSHTYTPISTTELTERFTCAWRSNCFLNTDKLLSYYPMPPIQTRIEEIVKQYALAV